MERISQHKILVAADTYEQGCLQVHRFFDLTTLVIYDCIETIRSKSLNGLDADFASAIQTAQDRNRAVVRNLLTEITSSGIDKVTDLERIEQGYLSKTLHILSHFMDGFVGIDSFFYNIPDDSHWLPQHTEAAIQKNPANFWLIHIDCFSSSPGDVSLLRM